jgi:Tfp pilus assembly protein PilV
MKKFSFLAVIIAAIGLLVPALASAATTADILTALQDVRTKGAALVRTTDKTEQSKLVEEIKAASQQVEAQLTAVESDAATSPDVKASLTEFRTVWSEFQQTRDTEIIPAALAGDLEKATSNRDLQQERMKKMTSLLK